VEVKQISYWGSEHGLVPPPHDGGHDSGRVPISRGKLDAGEIVECGAARVYGCGCCDVGRGGFQAA
jgi:hypothetical protein